MEVGKELLSIRLNCTADHLDEVMAAILLAVQKIGSSPEAILYAKTHQRLLLSQHEVAIRSLLSQ